jgi:hypothetical protein
LGIVNVKAEVRDEENTLGRLADRGFTGGTSIAFTRWAGSFLLGSFAIYGRRRRISSGGSCSFTSGGSVFDDLLGLFAL